MLNNVSKVALSLALPLALAGTAATAAPLRIMPLGDSITEGYTPNPPNGTGLGTASYREELETLLTQDGCSFEMVGSQTTNSPGNPLVFTGFHEGWGGHRADQLRNGHSGNTNVVQNMADHTPDVVLLHAGSNDMYGGQSVSSTVDDIEGLISDILGPYPSTVIFVANVIPWHDDDNNQWNPDIEGSVELLGDALDIAIPALGNPNVILVDVRTGFGENFMQEDLIHPKASGEAYLAGKWHAAIIAKNLCEDEIVPDTTIDSSVIQTGTNVEFQGTATDSGNSGFNRVDIAIENANYSSNNNRWWNFNAGGFGPIVVNGVAVGIKAAVLSDPLSLTNTDWAIQVSGLPIKDIRLYALAVDNAGNDAYHGTGLSVWPVNLLYQHCEDKIATVNLNTGAGAPTSGNDVILGTSSADSIRALAGDDIICGMGGDDIIQGNSGNDWISGGDGDDEIRGGQGLDTIYGKAGNDILYGNNNNDILSGNGGNDTINGGRGDDDLKGGAGDDNLYGGQENDNLNGGGNDDYLNGGAGDDTLIGGSGSGDHCDGRGGSGDTANSNCELISNVP